MEIGALYRGENRCDFVVWAPEAGRMSVRIVSRHERTVPLRRSERGYWCAEVEDVRHGARYFYRIDDRIDRPDPASRWQPEDVHGPSAVVDHTAFGWTDAGWRGMPLDRMVMYELHTGTFTPEGTFDAVIPRLDALGRLGITTISLMPVAQFPGNRNWGYDGVYPYAVQTSYGGPEGLKRLVDACHARGLAVILDVVYNHLGPEGNYLGEFGPYFTGRYRTPWGMAVNYDGEWSDEVRNYVIGNALAWLGDYHMDGLRLDAVHGIYDFSARHILAELTERVDDYSREQGRRYHIIAESDLNDTVVIRPRSEYGWGCHAQWNDDFHHALHALLTGEREGYYEDFGAVADLAASLRDGYVYSGRYSRFRKRRHGNSSRGQPADRFVVFSQNHDQVGNRMPGGRLGALVPFEALKLAAGAVILSPYIPLLFMGEEYGEPAPFQYFVSHHDPALAEAVREGRKQEFAAFHADAEPPDPGDPETFRRSKLDWDIRGGGRHAALLRWYTALIGFRSRLSAPVRRESESFDVDADEKYRTIVMRRGDPDGIAVIMHFGADECPVSIGGPPVNWRRVIDAAEPEYLGPGGALPETAESSDTLTAGPYAFAVYQREL